MSMIAAILFDLFETLVTEHGMAAPRASAQGEALGLEPAAFRPAWKRKRPFVLRGRLSFADALVQIGTELGFVPDEDAVRAVRDERIRARTQVLDRVRPELVALIRTLRHQGIRLATVSNCFAEDIQAWNGCAFAPHFDCTVFSCHVGMAKPQPEIYLEATRRLGVLPAESLFIGDGGDDELAGAERAGLRAVQAVWFVDEGRDPWPARVSDARQVLQLVSTG
jgi:HAD superfamily hydrolase (TIGR01509 family)